MSDFLIEAVQLGSLVGVVFGGLRRSAEQSDVESRKETSKNRISRQGRKERQETPTRSVVEFVYESFDVPIEELTAKVYQSSKFKVRKFQTGKNLFLVDAGEGLDGFQLDQQHFVHRFQKSGS